MNIKRTESRQYRGPDPSKANRWCEVQVSITETSPGKQRLLICGATGSIVKRAEAKRMAIGYWCSFFEENPHELINLGKRRNGTYHTEASAARYVVSVDGEFHGLDVHRDAGSKVWLLNTCGQCLTEIREFFPEVVPYLKWHLNDMRVSPERIVTPEREGEDAWGNRITIPAVIAPAGASWDYEPLPQDVIDWAMAFGAQP